MNKYSNIVVLFILLMSAGIQAQEPFDSTRLTTDTLSLQPKLIVKKYVVLIPDSLKPKAFKPDPLKVVWMGAIIPGFGQILNRKYWKLPIVYGGFLGCAYAITWNSGKYQNYKNAYRDILQYQSDPIYKAQVDKDPSKVSFIQIIPKGYTIETIGGISQWTKTMQSKQETYRRYRDLSLIATIGYYAITIVEAYVDAQLYDFDISPDLSLRFQPTLLNDRSGFSNTLGLQCSLSLK
ncbi:MAG TPA: DUF5683 domain-containing protein [Paludibacter sp.]